MHALAGRGLLRLPQDARRLRSIVDVTWIVSENWLNYTEYHDRQITVATILDGYYEILEVLRPYLCADPQQITQESYHTIERLAEPPGVTAQQIAVDAPAWGGASPN
jgi:hypothetical protein